MYVVLQPAIIKVFVFLQVRNKWGKTECDPHKRVLTVDLYVYSFVIYWRLSLRLVDYVCLRACFKDSMFDDQFKTKSLSHFCKCKCVSHIWLKIQCQILETISTVVSYNVLVRPVVSYLMIWLNVYFLIQCGWYAKLKLKT